MYLFKVVLFSILYLVYSSDIEKTSVEFDDLKEFNPNVHEDIKNFFKLVGNEQDEEATHQLNAFFDNQFRYVKYYGYYAVPLPNIEIEFKHQLEEADFNGNILLRKGALVGIDLKRRSDVTLSYSYPIATLGMSVGYSDVHYLYHYKGKFMNLVTRGGLRGKISDVTYNLVLDMDVVDLRFALKEFDLLDFGKVINKIEGELTTFRANVFSNVTEPIVGTYIEPALTGYTHNITTILLSWYNRFIST